jgi:hypothetical protein
MTSWWQKVVSIVALVVLVSSGSALVSEEAPHTGSAPAAAEEKCQLRVFTINRDKLADFTKAWQEGVLPLRRKQGFTVPFAWAVPETNQFFWLLCYAGPEDWEAKDKAYYASEERSRLTPDPRQFIARVERWFVVPILSQR